MRKIGRLAVFVTSLTAKPVFLSPSNYLVVLSAGKYYLFKLPVFNILFGFGPNWTITSFVDRKGKVPDVLIATIQPPQGMNVTGRGCLIQARLCRPKRAESRGDQQAKEVSDGLPFLEYELHRQLINKLRTKGMNSIFGLKVQKRKKNLNDECFQSL